MPGDGRRFSIRGPEIVTPAGKAWKAIRRHWYSYVVPPPEPGTGQTIYMTLLNENTVHLRLGESLTTPETSVLLRHGSARAKVYRRPEQSSIQLPRLPSSAAVCHVECPCGGKGEIERPALVEWPTVINDDNNAATSFSIGDTQSHRNSASPTGIVHVAEPTRLGVIDRVAFRRRPNAPGKAVDARIARDL